MINELTQCYPKKNSPGILCAMQLIDIILCHYTICLKHQEEIILIKCRGGGCQGVTRCRPQLLCQLTYFYTKQYSPVLLCVLHTTNFLLCHDRFCLNYQEDIKLIKCRETQNIQGIPRIMPQLLHDLTQCYPKQHLPGLLFNVKIINFLRCHDMFCSKHQEYIT